MNIAYTSTVGRNAVAFANICRMYLRPDSLVLDATYGKGSFWTIAKDFWLRRVATDIQQRPGVDIVADAKRLPFMPGTFDAVVLDPPYLRGCAISSEKFGHDMHERYGLQAKIFNWKDLMGMYSDMMVEAKRVLRKRGILIVKGMDDRQDFFLRDLPIPDGMRLIDVHVVTTTSKPMMRHQYQQHARKNHSYFVVLK